MKNAAGKIGRNRKGRRAVLWVVTLIVSFQVPGWFLFSMATPVPVEAKTFIVTSTLDETDANPGNGICTTASDTCTLRAAIQEANALDGPDSIKLKTGLYMLTIAGISENGCATGDLDITDSLTIIGTGAKNTFINAGKIDRVFHIMGDVAVKMTNVTIQNGLATDEGGSEAFGGAILNEGGTLKVTASTLSNNAAFANYVWGGAIYSQSGEVTVGKSIISNNLARGISQSIGGGISINGATLTIKGSTLSMNSALGVGVDATSWGGGIWLKGGFVTVEKSTISNNVAGGSYVGHGGGICNENGTLAVTGSTISNNSAGGPSSGYGGGIRNMDTATVTGSTISNNSALGMGGSAQGGGIYNDGTLTVTGSKIYNNSALGVDDVSGGGISNVYLTLTVTGSTISNNSATAMAGLGAGGGISISGATLTIKGSNLSNNTASGSESSWGGGICSQSSDVTVDSSTISGNAASGMPGPGFGGGISHMGNTLLTVQNGSKIIKNLASAVGGGIYTDIYDWSSSTDSTVDKNAPDNIFYD